MAMDRPDRVKEGDFREWYFPVEEIVGWTKQFLQDVGYEILPETYIGFAKPDFHAKRVEGDKTYEIVGIGCQHFDVALEGLTKLAAIRSVRGDKIDYTIVVPPVNEFLMLEFFRTEKGWKYFEIKRNKFMVWFANPDEEYVWCLVGEPLDKTCKEYFALGKQSLDGVLAMQLSKELWEEEEY